VVTAEPVLELDADPLLLDPVLDPEFEPLLDPVATVPDVAACVRASAGSLPETSWASITVQAARNTATAIPTAHLRIVLARRRRASIA
jgi:hypothetical protein